MFGQNPIRKQELGDGQTLRIQEIFPTLQGEGPFAGVRSVFCRTAGCPLKCLFCDTDFETRIDNVLCIGEVVGRVRAYYYAPGLVVLTGGEPFRQNIGPLVESLIHEGYHVQIETAGVMWLAGFQRFLDVSPSPSKPGCSIVVSPKTGRVVEEIATWAYAWKYIVRTVDRCGDDGLPCESTQVLGQKVKLARPPQWFPRERVFLQPCEEYTQTTSPRVELVSDEVRTKSNMQLAVDLCMRHGYRLSIQLHKQLGLP